MKHNTLIITCCPIGVVVWQDIPVDPNEHAIVVIVVEADPWEGL